MTSVSPPAVMYPRPAILICHDDRAFIETVCEVSETGGYLPIVLTEARYVKAAYLAHTPRLILSEFFLQDLDGIELVNWLIGKDNRSGVILTISRDQSFTRTTVVLESLIRAAVALAETADIFPLSILERPASRTRIAELL